MYQPILKRIDEFLYERLSQALVIRRKRAKQVLELDEAVSAAVAALKARGFQSPYLKAFVVARINYLRFKKGKAEFDETIEKYWGRSRGNFAAVRKKCRQTGDGIPILRQVNVKRGRECRQHDRYKKIEGKQRQRQDVISGAGYASQNDQRLHFGLGAATKVDKPFFINANITDPHRPFPGGEAKKGRKASRKAGSVDARVKASEKLRYRRRGSPPVTRSRGTRGTSRPRPPARPG